MATVPLTHDWSANQWDWPLQEHDGVVKVINTKDKFEVGLATTAFAPNEINVQVLAQDLVVTCSHEERSDPHGRVSRTIQRTYKLPEDVDTSSVKSHLTKYGVLMITANKKQ